MLNIVKLGPEEYAVKNDSGCRVGELSKQHDGLFYLFSREEVSWSVDNLSWLAIKLHILNIGEEV